MTTTTETRLAAYLAAEASILKAQEVRNGDRAFRQTELREVRDQINKLERQLARERSAASGRGGMSFSVANLSGE
jgi:hypothetical protein